MHKKLVLTAFAILAISLMLVPVNAWVYPWSDRDLKFEKFGPRLDGIFIKMYAGTAKEWGGMKAHEIDVTDWPLTKYWYDQFVGDPAFKLVEYPSPPGEAGYYIEYLNHNDDDFLIWARQATLKADANIGATRVYTNENVSAVGFTPGDYAEIGVGEVTEERRTVVGVVPTTPPYYIDLGAGLTYKHFTGEVVSPASPNPVINFPSAGSRNPTSDVWFRRALAHIIDRTWITTTLLPGFSFAMYTPVPVYMEPIGWLNRDIAPGESLEALTYPTNITRANEILNTTGFPVDPLTGFRYWDRDASGTHGAGEDLKLITWTRNDHTPGRFEIGSKFNVDMKTALPAGLGIELEENYARSGVCYVNVMLNKRYHTYTAGWIFIGPEPDYLYDLYHSSMYWHDPESDCPNTDAVRDATLDGYAYNIKFGTSVPLINQSAWDFQERFATMVHGIPLYCNRGVKVSHVNYVGPEAPYTGKAWKSLVDEQGFGTNSWWSFLNMHVDGFKYGGIVRYGWSQTSMPVSLNPIYASWYWDFEVIGKIYDAPGVRNPNARGTYLPWLIKGWEKGTWLRGDKIRMTIRPDVVWQDGTPMTVADFLWSYDEMIDMLLDMGYAPPWYYSSVQHIVSMYVVDPYTVEILYDVNSGWTELWALIGVLIVPKHIWKPIVESGDPTGFQPDPALVGTGPYKFVRLTEGISCELERNPRFWKSEPKDVNVLAERTSGIPGPGTTHDAGHLGRAKITVPKTQTSIQVNLTVTDHNLLEDQFILGTETLWLENITYLDPTAPISSYWRVQPGQPRFPREYIFHLSSWEDTGDPIGMLSVSDIIDMTKQPYGVKIFFHIKNMYLEPTGTWKIEVEEVDPRTWIPDPRENPVGWVWHGEWPGRWPDFPGIISCEFIVTYWIDQNPDRILGVSDVLKIEALDFPGKPMWFHVQQFYYNPPEQNWKMRLGEVLFEDKYVYVDNNLINEVWVENITNVDLNAPISTRWHELRPVPSRILHLTSWFIDSPPEGELSVSDKIDMTPEVPPSPVEYYHVKAVIIEPLLQKVYLVLQPVEIAKPCIPIEELFPVILTRGKHNITIAKHIQAPLWELLQNNTVIPNPWVSHWIRVTLLIWVTVKEDIAGSTYYDDIGFLTYPAKLKKQVPTPDTAVDGKDISLAAGAFGSEPGHPRWNSVADISGDYFVDGKDISGIAKLFGWPG